MKKRIISLLMAVAVMLSVAIGSVHTVSAVSAMETSEACVEMIKQEEGFVQYPVWDYAQYSVGYGTKCPDELLAHYSAHGITYEEADVLLRQYLDRFEEDINVDLIDKFGLTLSQNQFDALIMFSYNCGTGWIYNDSDNLRRAVISGATGNEVIDRFTRWCNAGGQIKVFLIKRRLAEANLYLNAVYSRKVPDNFGYVLYDANGGVSNPNVQGYSIDLTAGIIPTPTYAGYEFAGWYTAREGGTQVTVLDASTRNTRLYARWKDAQGNELVDDPNTLRVTVSCNGVNLREGPTTSSKVIGMAYTGDVFYITEIAQADGYTWGKYSNGWICLDLTDYVPSDNTPTQPETSTQPEISTQPESTTVMGTVKVSDCLRIRSGSSTGHDVVGYLNNGARVQILEQKIVGAMTWGRIDKGWISMDYVVLDAAQQTPAPTTPTEPAPTEPAPTEPAPTEPAPTEPPAPPVSQPTSWTGTVRVNDCLRVRSGPGTSYAVAGYLYPNQRITVTEKQTVGATTWGKTDKGWVSLDYVVLDSTDSNTQTQTVWGTINVNQFLRIRRGPSTSYAIAGYLGPKDRVQILEQQSVGGTTWGRIEQGWISLDYVILDGAASSAPQPAVQTKTVVADCLRVRSDAGTGHSIVGYLYNGAKVEILQTTVVGNTTWGKIKNGWISLDYVR